MSSGVLRCGSRYRCQHEAAAQNTTEFVRNSLARSPRENIIGCDAVLVCLLISPLLSSCNSPTTALTHTLQIYPSGHKFSSTPTLALGLTLALTLTLTVKVTINLTLILTNADGQTSRKPSHSCSSVQQTGAPQRRLASYKHLVDFRLSRHIRLSFPTDVDVWFSTHLRSLVTRQKMKRRENRTEKIKRKVTRDHKHEKNAKTNETKRNDESSAEAKAAPSQRRMWKAAPPTRRGAGRETTPSPLPLFLLLPCPALRCCSTHCTCCPAPSAPSACPPPSVPFPPVPFLPCPHPASHPAPRPKKT